MRPPASSRFRVRVPLPPPARRLPGPPSDFAALNDFLAHVTLSLPDVSENLEYGSGFMSIDVEVDLTNFECNGLNVGGVSIGASPDESDARWAVSMDASDVVLSCRAAFRYDLGFLGTGSGDMSMDVSVASFSAGFGLASEGAGGSLPRVSSLERCAATAEVSEVELTGTFLTSLADLFSDRIGKEMSGKVEDEICRVADQIDDALAAGLNATADALIEMASMGEGEEPAAPTREVPTGPGGPRLLDLTSDKVAGAVGYANTELVSGSKPAAFLREVLGEDGTIAVSASDLHMGDGAVLFRRKDDLFDASVALAGARLSVVESFSRFDLLTITGPQNLSGGLALDGIRLEADLQLTLIPTGSERALMENITVSLVFTEVDLDLDLLLSVDLDALEAVRLGSVMHLPNIFPCFMASTLALNFTNSALTVDVVAPSVSDYVSGGFTEVLAMILNVYFSVGESVFKELLPTALGNQIPRALEGLLEGRDGASCPAPDAPGAPGGVVDFRHLFGTDGAPANGMLFPAVRRAVDSLLAETDPVTGAPGINSFVVGPVTRFQSGTAGALLFPDELFFTDFALPDIGIRRLRIVVADVSFENLDTVAPGATLLDVEGPRTLRTELAVGGAGTPVRIKFGFSMTVEYYDGREFSNDVEFSTELADARLVVVADLPMGEGRLLGYPLGDVLDIKCWAATLLAGEGGVPGAADVDPKGIGAAVERFVLELGAVEFGADCISCDSPYFEDVSTHISTPAVEEMLNRQLRAFTGFLSDFVVTDPFRSLLHAAIDDARRECPHDPLYGKTSANGLKIVDSWALPQENTAIHASLLWVGGLALAAYVAYSLRKCCGGKKDEKHESAQEGVVLGKPMVTDPNLPLVFRVLAPFVVVANVGLFISGHLNLGAMVRVDMLVFGENYAVDNFFQFSLANSVFQLWDAGAKELSIIVFIFSGIWPYVKQFATLALLFLPTSRVSPERRGSVLEWLDALGKWSMLDVFMLVLAVLNFRISLSSPTILPPESYSVDLMVVPVWGLYANLIAQLLSQVSSHFIIHYNRVSVSWLKVNQYFLAQESSLDEEVQPVDEEVQPVPPVPKVTSLSVHAFQRGTLRLRPAARWGVCAVAVSLLVLFIVGWTVPTCRIRVVGLLGVVLSFGDDGGSPRVAYSVFSVTAWLAALTGDMDGPWLQAGIVLLVAVFVATIVVVPVALIGIGLVLWLAPLGIHVKKGLLSTIEVLSAWQYVEVYVLSMIMSSLFLAETSSFMLKRQCKDLDNFINSLVSGGLISPEDGRCFTLVSTLKPDVFILIVACVCLSALTRGLNWYVSAVRNDEAGDPCDGRDSGDCEVGTGWASFLFKEVAPVGLSLEPSAPPLPDSSSPQRNLAEGDAVGTAKATPSAAPQQICEAETNTV